LDVEEGDLEVARRRGRLPHMGYSVLSAAIGEIDAATLAGIMAAAAAETPSALAATASAAGS